MARKIELEFNKTYASELNAVAAVGKLAARYQAKDWDKLRYMIVPVVQDGGTVRFGVVFIGEFALQMQLHFHFNVLV